MQNDKIGVVILAAGSSSRLGYAKQLVSFKGKSLVQHTIDVSDVLDLDTQILVLGAKSAEIKSKIEPKNFEIVINDNWEEGMASSIRLGLKRSQELQKNLDHLLILLSDQPFVSTEKIEKLIKVHLKKKSVASFSKYAGDTGVPAIFSSVLFPALEALEGDQGARKLIHKQEFDFETVPFEKGNFDVDTPEDVALLKNLELEDQ